MLSVHDGALGMAFQAPTRNLIRAAHAAYNRPRAASQGLLPAATFVPSGRIAVAGKRFRDPASPLEG